MDNPIKMQSKAGALSAEVDLNGGMLSCLRLHREGKETVDLLHRAPWLPEDFYNDAPEMINHFSGEWICVPFGVVAYDSKLFSSDHPHGMPCHSAWTVDSCTDDKIVLNYDFPEWHTFKGIKRTIELTDDCVKFSFTLVSKKDCEVPLGVHPIFPTGGENDDLELDIVGDGIVYETECEEGVSLLDPGKLFDSLDKLPLMGSNNTMSIKHLPLEHDTEEIVQMLHPQGKAVLTYKNKGVRLTLSWDDKKFPSCLLWISNRGRKYEPWSGVNSCIGIEPVAAYFDFGEDSLVSNPINVGSVKTAVSLKENEPFTFDYSIAIEKLD